MTDGEAESEPDAERGPEAGSGPDAATGSHPEEGTDRPEGETAGATEGNEVAEESTDTHGEGGVSESVVTPVAEGPSEESAEPSTDIDVEALTGPTRRLDPRVRYVWVLGSVMGSLMLGAVAGVAGFVALGEPLVGPAAFLFVFALGAVLAVLRYRSWSYEVREDSLYLERGVLTHTRTVVPYVRIQHVDASRGPVERTLGLSTVVVYTAGSRGADVSIPGLTADRAEDLQERLKRLAIAAEGEDAV